MPIRDLQAKMAEVGRIRTGFKDPDKKYADRLDAFRLTSPRRALIEAAAEAFGGTVIPWQPQNGGPPQWEVRTEVNEIPVIVPRQVIDPWMEAWKPGQCIRRCDGERTVVPDDQPCICKAQQLSKKDACKPTTRVNVELPDIPVLGWWRLDSHGWRTASLMTSIAPLVQILPKGIPGTLILTKQPRRVPDPRDPSKTIQQDIAYSWIQIDGVTARQAALGGDALSQAINAALGAGEQTAIEAPQRLAIGGADPDLDKKRNAVMGWIESADTVDKVLKCLERAKQYGLALDQTIYASAASKTSAIQAAERVGGSALPASRRTVTRYDNNPSDVIDAQPIDEYVEATEEPEPVPDTGSYGPTDDDRFDVDDEYTRVMNQAAKLGWSTAHTNDKVTEFCHVERASQASGAQLNAMAAAMRRGEFT